MPSHVDANAAPDPIFAAIEKHRSAALAFLAAADENCRLQEELPRDRQRSRVTCYETVIVEGDDLRWIASERTTVAHADEMDEAAHELLDVTPNTIAGVQALLRYAAGSRGRRRNRLRVAGGGGGRNAEAAHRRLPMGFFMARNLASALAKIEAANQLG
jgi:hypothetical protein